MLLSYLIIQSLCSRGVTSRGSRAISVDNMRTEEQKRKNAEYMRRYRQGDREETRARNRKWRLEHPEQWQQIQKTSNKKYREKNRERLNENNRKSYHANLEKQRERGRDKAKRIRLAVLTHYGLSCACCGESTYQFLTIDHINGGGGKHRRSIGSMGGWTFYRWLIKNEFPKEFQTLCFNCNISKGLYGHCPHQLNTQLQNHPS